MCQLSRLLIQERVVIYIWFSIRCSPKYTVDINCLWRQAVRSAI
jgi:hypothetical protein